MDAGAIRDDVGRRPRRAARPGPAAAPAPRAGRAPLGREATADEEHPRRAAGRGARVRPGRNRSRSSPGAAPRCGPSARRPAPSWRPSPWRRRSRRPAPSARRSRRRLGASSARDQGRTGRHTPIACHAQTDASREQHDRRCRAGNAPTKSALEWVFRHATSGRTRCDRLVERPAHDACPARHASARSGGPRRARRGPGPAARRSGRSAASAAAPTRRQVDVPGLERLHRRRHGGRGPARRCRAPPRSPAAPARLRGQDSNRRRGRCNTAGSVADRMAMSRPSDHPETYW